MAKHDTIPQVDFFVNPLEGHAFLHAFLSAEHEDYVPPYKPVRDALQRILDEIESRKRQGQAPSAEVADSRIRTWRAVFESFGFLEVDSVTQRIALTPLGRAVRSLLATLNEKVEGANDRLAKLAVGVLVRHHLRNPVFGADYPQDADLRPYKFMLRAMRRLDDKLHWEELNRVLMRVLYKKDEAAAITHIATVRKQTGGVYTVKNVAQLGAPTVDDAQETKRRITPWFSQASFGGLLITPVDDEEGFRHLVEKYKPLIDAALEQEAPLPPDAKTSREAYLKYVTQETSEQAVVESEGDKADVQRVLDALARFGETKLIVLAGIPSTGKTRLAKMAAMRLVDGDSYRFTEIQFHPSTTYDDFIEGFVPKPSGDGYELVPKTFRVMNRRARMDPTSAKYVILIEEFTRADVHSVLGELLTYVEHRDRPFRLATSGLEERVAPNLVFLATMNPRDKTALTLDDAILRRLHQVKVLSSPTTLQEMLKGKLDAGLLDLLGVWFDKYYQILPFGHAEFAGARDADHLRSIWQGTLQFFLQDMVGSVREVYKSAADEYPWK